MLEKVKNTIINNRLLQKGERVVLGFSGGVDSVCLLHLLWNLEEFQLDIRPLYVDHGLRPEENRREWRLLQEVGAKLGVEVKRIDINLPERLREKPQSLQLLAREERYRVFEEFRSEIGAAKIALAHHRDDQAETILYRIIRGTGIDGLAGMPIMRDGIFIRPLLDVTRKEIEEYAVGHGLRWEEDSSNRKLIYDRNKLRRVLIPEIETGYNPNFKGALLRLGKLAGEQRDFMSGLARECGKQLVVREEARIGLKVRPFLELHPYLQYYLLKQVFLTIGPFLQLESWRFQKLRDKINRENWGFKAAQIGKGIFGYIENDILYFEKSPVKTDRVWEYGLTAPGITALPELGLRISIAETDLPSDWRAVSRNEIYVDAAALKLPLRLRSWRPGDWFRPLGLNGTQKLHDFFINRKIPRRQRRENPLLVTADDRIVWVVGQRPAEDFKIGAITRKIWRIAFRPFVED